MHKLLAAIMLMTTLLSGYAQAGMVSTQDLINHGSESFSQEQLQTAMASDELRSQLAELGVDADQLNDRITSLTPSEIAQLNAELAEQPAGGIVGVLLAIFLIFVITDMLCATDVFGFVKCINK
jgi:TolA-binding protein